MLKDYIGQIQKDLALSFPIEQENDGTWLIMLDAIQITIQEEHQGFRLYAVIGSMPESKNEEFLAHMLRANLFGQATKDAWIGLDENGTQIIIQMTKPEKVTYRDFKESFEDFINVIDFWTEEIKSNV